MKPFDLEAALAGAAVCTGNGVQVFELTQFNLKDTEFVLRGVLNGRLCPWTVDGCYYSGGISATADLFMAPVKKEGWINIYPGHHATSRLTSNAYQIEEDAINHRAKTCIATVRVEWEE